MSALVFGLDAVVFKYTMMRHDRIFQLFILYQRAMNSVGRKISWPSARDKTKTYMWRNLETFAKKLEQIGMEHYAPAMIRIIVNYGRSNGLLQKGICILHHHDIFEICYNELKAQVKRDLQLVETIRNCALFVKEKQNGESVRELLLYRRSPGSFANITCWFQTGRLNKSYIALSKNCCNALRQLDNVERTEFPTAAELIKLRQRLLSNDNIATDLINILGTDINRGGTV